MVDSMCESFGRGSRVVEVAKTEDGSNFSVTVDIPKPLKQTNEDWWNQVRELRNKLESIEGVQKVYLLIESKTPS